MKINFSKKFFILFLLVISPFFESKAMGNTAVNNCIAGQIRRDARNGLVTSPKQLLEVCEWVEAYYQRYGVEPSNNIGPTFESIPVRELLPLYPYFW